MLMSARTANLGAGYVTTRLQPRDGGDLSFQAMGWALEQKEIFGNDKYVLFMLAYRDNPDEPHGCYPSLARIASDCGIDKSTVVRSLDKLESSRKIKRTPRKKPDGTDSSTHYSLIGVWNDSVAPRNTSRRATQQSLSHSAPTPCRTVQHELKDLTEIEPKKPRVLSFCVHCNKTKSFHSRPLKNILRENPRWMQHEFEEIA